MAQAKSDGLQLLRAINATQAHAKRGPGWIPPGPPTRPG